MSLEVKVGPPQLAIHQGHAVLLTVPDGQINGHSQKGLYFYDTRVISNWTVYANGEPWELLNSGATAAFAEKKRLVHQQAFQYIQDAANLNEPEVSPAVASMIANPLSQ